MDVQADTHVEHRVIPRLASANVCQVYLEINVTIVRIAPYSTKEEVVKLVTSVRMIF